MHYDAYAFSRNGRPTLESLDRNVNIRNIGQRINFSKSDVQHVNTLYKCPTGWLKWLLATKMEQHTFACLYEYSMLLSSSQTYISWFDLQVVWGPGIHGADGHHVQPLVVVESKLAQELALVLGVQVSLDKPETVIQTTSVQPLTPGEHGVPGAHVQPLVVLDVAHVPGPVRVLGVEDWVPKLNTAISELVLHQPPLEAGVPGVAGHHVHPPVEAAFSFGQGDASHIHLLAADQEKAMNSDHVAVGSVLLPLSLHITSMWATTLTSPKLVRSYILLCACMFAVDALHGY